MDVIEIDGNDVFHAIPQIQLGKACAYDGLRDNFLNLNKIAEIAETEIKIASTRNAKQ